MRQSAEQQVMLDVLMTKHTVTENARGEDVNTGSDTEIDFQLPVLSKANLDDLEHRLRNEPTFKKKLVIFHSLDLTLF